MGNWTLEVAKMALYISFPVVMFHIFNQPEYFEDWVVKSKREVLPPNDRERREYFDDAIRKINARDEARRLALLKREET